MPPKVFIKQRSKAPTKATQKPKPKEKNLYRDALLDVDIFDGAKLSTDQVDVLLSLKYPNDDPVINSYQSAVEVIALLKKLPYSQVVTYLRDVSNLSTLTFSSPLFENERQKVQLELDNLQSKIEAEKGLYKCQSCGSQETLSYGRQVRSPDEPMTVFVECLGCNRRWRID